MPTQNPDDGTQFIIAIFFIAVFIFLLMVIGVVIMALPQLGGRGKSMQTASRERPAPSSEEAAPPEATSAAAEVAPEMEWTWPSPLGDHVEIPPEHEQELVVEAASAAQTAPEMEPTPTYPLSERTEKNPEQSQESIDVESWSTRQILGVALTCVLIMAPLLVAITFPNVFGASAFPGLLFVPLWTALAGAIGLRAARLSWQQSVLAAVLAGTALPGIAGSLAGPYGLLVLFAGLIWVSGGVFFLPLFDPVVRKTGPAPSTWKVAITALALSAPFLAAYNLQRNPTIPVLLSCIFLAGGFILVLSKRYAATASWLGGLGILFAWFMLVGGVGMDAVMSRLPR